MDTFMPEVDVHYGQSVMSIEVQQQNTIMPLLVSLSLPTWALESPRETRGTPRRSTLYKKTTALLQVVCVKKCLSKARIIISPSTQVTFTARLDNCSCPASYACSCPFLPKHVYVGFCQHSILIFLWRGNAYFRSMSRLLSAIWAMWYLQPSLQNCHICFNDNWTYFILEHFLVTAPRPGSKRGP